MEFFSWCVACSKFTRIEYLILLLINNMSLEDYEIIEAIGSGTYSTVFKVRCKSSGVLFAMKEIKFERLSAKEKEYAKTEVKILKQINHPNIISFEKSFSSGSNFYIIMELASAGDLQNKITDCSLKNINFPLETIWAYTYQIVLGLQVLHENNILHRDIKASNIFIMESGKVKIGDFNIGKEAIETLLCTKIGTPIMMSPEMWNGQNYTFKADIWSLGCLVYQMAALRPPFFAENYAALYMKISKHKYEKLVNYPKSLSNFIEKLLKKSPKLRPSCGQILQFEEFKRFKADGCEDNQKSSERKTLKKDTAYYKLEPLVSSNSKDIFSLRRRRQNISPTHNLRMQHMTPNKKLSRDLNSPYIYNPREITPNISPNLHLYSPYRNLQDKNQMFKDYSLQFLKPIDSCKHLAKGSKGCERRPSKYSIKLKKNSINDIKDFPGIESRNLSVKTLMNQQDYNQIKPISVPRLRKAVVVFLCK